jgi:uncharacterized protein YkwD
LTRTAKLGLTLGLAAAAATAVAAAPNTGGESAERLVAAETLELRVAKRINGVRRWYGLPPLRSSNALRLAARRHSRDMVRRGYFEHDFSGGPAFWRRIERSYDSEGFGRWEVGENILWSSPRTTAVEVVRRWLGSPTHRENVLSGTWRELGVGAYRVRRAGGAFGGRAVTIVTLDLGVRSRA